jgi:hypothetical protein
MMAANVCVKQSELVCPLAKNSTQFQQKNMYPSTANNYPYSFLLQDSFKMWV